MRRGESSLASSSSYSNGWSRSEVPSYMAATPPSSSSLSIDEHHHDDSNQKSKARKRPLRRRIMISTPPKDTIWKKIYNKYLPSSVWIAVMLWYTLGVLSIATSKILLTDLGVPPLYLTLQQLVFGTNYLRFLLHIRALDSAGLQPWPQKPPVSPMRYDGDEQPFHLKDLLLAGTYFSIGFFTTNLSFSAASAAFVETVKAAEPITSAAIAVAFGIEFLSQPEVFSLGAIVVGVLLSTLGNSHGGGGSEGDDEDIPLTAALQSCAIVMVSNLCFSFRSLHQKLFRTQPIGSPAVVDDMNLQFRMQLTGFYVLVVPTVLWDGRTVLMALWNGYGNALRYLGLSFVNGFAFTSYNLASTYVLTRISVVHHAVLNCVRRIFAVVVTSIIFGVPITIVGAIGVLTSVAGFLSFTRYKQKRKRQPKPISTLLPTSVM